jgi:hypothetical protein
MARFIGYVEGNRGEASRLGTPSSGIRAQAQGWNSGVTVHGYVDQLGRDCFAVTITGGSNGNGGTRELARIVDGTIVSLIDDLNV